MMENQPAVLVPQISKEETKRFAEQWRYNSLCVPMDDAALQFASDWANTVLRSVVPLIMKSAMTAAVAMVQKNVNDTPKSSIILEAE
jgi:hypothetical protein